MARFRIKKDFRNRLSEKLIDLGNYSFVGLVLGQFIGGNEFSEAVFVGGIIFSVSCYFASYMLSL